MLVTLFSITQNGTKRAVVKQKKLYLEESETLFERQKDNRKQRNPLLQVLIHKRNLYLAHNISKRILKKEHTTSSEIEKNRTSQTPCQTFHLERWTRYF